ncbi:MAG: cupin domain-containing protein, partial [Chitinophagaceae bacterium]
MLKPAFEAVQAYQSSSFLLRTFQKEAFQAPYHFHPEFELTLITGGTGKRYVGNRMEDFTIGDLVFLGANLPHCWKLTTQNKNDYNTKSPKSSIDPSAIVIQFTDDFLGKDFLKKPELRTIGRLLQLSKNGLQFAGKTRINTEQKIKLLTTRKSSFEKMIGLLQILEQLSLSGEYRLLSPQNIVTATTHADQQRIQ